MAILETRTGDFKKVALKPIVTSERLSTLSRHFEANMQSQLSQSAGGSTKRISMRIFALLELPTVRLISANL
jgi:hypothetical protein